MKPILLVVILLISSLTQADLYKKIQCLSSANVKTKGPKGEFEFGKGNFSVEENQSQVIKVATSKGVVLLKIYPWFGVDYKASKLISMGEKLTSSSTDFSFSFTEKKTKKVYSISCKKI